jgi:hypothetical protein
MEKESKSCEVRLVVNKIALQFTSLYLVEPLLPVGVEGTKLLQHISGKYA